MIWLLCLESEKHWILRSCSQGKNWIRVECPLARSWTPIGSAKRQCWSHRFRARASKVSAAVLQIYFFRIRERSAREVSSIDVQLVFVLFVWFVGFCFLGRLPRRRRRGKRGLWHWSAFAVKEHSCSSSLLHWLSTSDIEVLTLWIMIIYVFDNIIIFLHW